MKLNHAKAIVQEEKYVEAQRVIAEAENKDTPEAPVEENPTEIPAPVEEVEDNNG